MIEKVEVSGPFTLVSVEPQPPISVEQGTSVTLKMVIDPPAYSYSGPAVIKLGAHAEIYEKVSPKGHAGGVIEFLKATAGNV